MKLKTGYKPDVDHPNYGALTVDHFDLGQVVGERVALEIFKRQDDEYSLQYAAVNWKRESDPDSIPWDEVNQEERGRHWRLVYRYYPRRKK